MNKTEWLDAFVQDLIYGQDPLGVAGFSVVETRWRLNAGGRIVAGSL